MLWDEEVRLGSNLRVRTLQNPSNLENPAEPVEPAEPWRTLQNPCENLANPRITYIDRMASHGASELFEIGGRELTISNP